MAENWVHVLIGATTDRVFESDLSPIVGTLCSVFDVLVEKVFFLCLNEVFSV